ncbi:acyl transferase domain-containing protein [Panacagrimonas perspica]|uniref:Acyl transferase domain-containing protein n=1 Tax=Panacagrimonas perspica TaxID=381431 RepID=A0A4S3K846_9GAMM|nr:type I polyketide synthase [Panacagrimonas perspica]TDU32056.1 acyl transferase domain-containing protein [Panacagrimonas perspica]THD04415.1 type I polyketide synthase [Panacagrimonas perspica]
MSKPLQIAIVGLAGCYPAAPDARTYWRNILAKVDAVADADPEWVGPYFEKDTTADDRTYTIKGGFLRGLAKVDPQSFGVMPSVAAGSDPDHLITLKIARDALADAGYLTRPFNREKAGVIIGRGTYGNRALGGMLARGFFFDQMLDIVQQLRPDFSETDMRELRVALKQQLPPHTGEHVGVLTPNVIAGLIANRLDLMGPSFIVDAACASTMMALESAIHELTSGRCDLMLAGGTHVHTPPQLFIQFCLINALSRDRIRPFQKGADGTLLGEGVGLMVLKRLADAERDGDRIYAVIQGIGTASDGKAKGLLAPRVEGEILALRRAYESCGIDPRTVDLIEAHGTGTAVGDKTEIEALSTIFGGRGKGPQIAVSAVKSMIGHCMPASGSAALIKTALALHHKVLPPMLCDEPDPQLELEKTPLYLNTEARPWVHGHATPRRAGVNAFGFGGINSHVILEEYCGAARSTQVSVLHAPGGSELVTLAADSAPELIRRIQLVLVHLRSELPPTLEEVAQACAGLWHQGAHRLAIIAADAAELAAKLDLVVSRLETPAPFRTRNGVHYGAGAPAGKLCFLFPGEGSQYSEMLADLYMSFPQVRDWFDTIEQNALGSGGDSRAAILFPAPTMIDAARRKQIEQRLFDMDVGSESVFAASLGLYSLFTDLGVVPSAMLGHSTGEHTALAAWTRGDRDRGRVLDGIRTLSAISRRLDREGQILAGTLLTVGGLKPAAREALLAERNGLVLAMDNCPNQVVLFGPAETASAVQERLSAQGAICVALPFGRAYHTPAFRPMADAILNYYSNVEIPAPLEKVELYSACSVATFPRDAAGICTLTARQWESPVRFTQTIQRLYADGYRAFVEIGPSGNLTAFVSDILRGQGGVLAVASNNRRKSGASQLHAALAELFVAGHAFDPRRLYSHRGIASVDLQAPPRKPGRPMLTLPLSMPTVRLPERFARPLPNGVASSVPAAGVALQEDAASAAALASADPRAAVMHAHFALMREFLDSQARVLGLATAASVPVPASIVATVTNSFDPEFPLLGVVVERKADRIVIERRFDLANDLFLLDHAIGATPSAHDPSLRPLSVVPFTFSMELLAEAATRLVDRRDRVLVGIDNARGSRWLSLDDGSVTVRIVAERAPGADVVTCRVFCPGDSKLPDGVLVFEGTVRFAAQHSEAPMPTPWRTEDNQPPRWHVDGQIYRHGMFHGPRLQGCKKVLRWGAGGMEADLGTLPTHDYFAGSPAPRFQFDAALLDAAGQLAGFWLRERYEDVRNCFPFRVRSLELFAPPPPAGARVTCRGGIRMDGDTQLEARWELIDEDGRVIMRAEGWEDRVFAVADRFSAFRANPSASPLSEPALATRLPAELCVRHVAPLPSGMLDEGGGIWKRVVAHMCLTRRELAQFETLPAGGARREEWLMGRLAAKDAARDWYRLRGNASLAPADLEIISDAAGRPRIHCASVATPPPAISIAHSRGHAYAVAGDPGVALGIDYQRLEHLRLDALIRGAFNTEEREWLDASHDAENLRRAAALWASKEAAAKAAGTGLAGGPLAWVVVAARLDRRAGDPTVARVRHAGRDYDVALHFDPDGGAVVALCVTMAAEPLPARSLPTFP